MTTKLSTSGPIQDALDSLTSLIHGMTAAIEAAQKGAGGAGWTDRNGHFWLFGGSRAATATAASGSFNDLWEYFP